MSYAFQSNKRAGIILIIENATDTNEAIRVNSIIRHYQLPVTLWVIDKESEELKLFSAEEEVAIEATLPIDESIVLPRLPDLIDGAFLKANIIL